MSAIYTGHVAHHRPGKHRLRYRVFMLALDIDQLPRLDETLKVFAHNRSALLSVHDRDHANRRRQALRPQIEDVLRDAGLCADGGRIVLMTMPRLFNYVFNPISVYFCYRRDGALGALVHEVSNTFGERHFYALPARAEGGRLRQECDKDFFVSPFLEPDLRYAFDVTPPGDIARLQITVWRDEEVALTTWFVGARRELTDANLLAAWAGNPLMTLNVILGIHWEAMKMLAKGIRYLGRAPATRATARAPRQVNP